MPNTIDLTDKSLSGLKKSEWLAQLSEIATAAGEFRALGPRHIMTCIDQMPDDDGAAPTTLLVTFETMQGIQLQSDIGQPLGWDMVRGQNWSHLGVISDGDTWFREPHVYALFDQLTDEGYFEAFDRVIFYGAGPCGYAAAAFSVAAPGARVLAVQPQATLDPRITEWDNRFTHLRRTSFTDRYGYAPDMLDAADQAFVIYDPAQDLDAMHAALFTRPNVTKLRLRYMGGALQGDLIAMGVLEDLLVGLADATLDLKQFARIARARRDHRSYLRNLIGHTDVAQRPYLAMLVCRNVVERLKMPRVRQRLRQLEQDAADGLFTPPPPRHGTALPDET